VSDLNRRSWDEFRDSGLLWWVNRTLHLFGWALVLRWEGDPATGEPKEVYPARVSFRGFSPEIEDEGFAKLEAHLRDTFGPRNQYEPDEVSPPGEVLQECLEERGLRLDDLGLDVDLLGGILNGSRAITPEVADKLGEVLGTNPTYWLRHEALYRASLARDRDPGTHQK